MQKAALQHERMYLYTDLYRHAVVNNPSTPPGCSQHPTKLAACLVACRVGGMVGSPRFSEAWAAVAWWQGVKSR